jgi:rRNA-processing protein FCF1
MAKIYPDTNSFIDFYQAAHENVDVFDELQKYKNSLVLTEQTVTEFRRNRVSILNQVVAQFEKSICLRPYTTAIMKLLPGHEEFTKLLTDYKGKGKEILQHLRQLIADEKKDPVAQKFLSLAADAGVMKLKLTDQAIDKAHRRKLLGNPPRSSERYSVGDEVIWELLLDGLKEDLIVVTKDRTFHENLSLLSEEYGQRTGRKLLRVTEKFSEALKGIGQEPSRKLIETEEKLPNFGWVTKGSGRHAKVLHDMVNKLISDYTEKVELETGEALGGDQHIVPIMRLLASLIAAQCDEVEADIKYDFFGMDPNEEI